MSTAQTQRVPWMVPAIDVTRMGSRYGTPSVERLADLVERMDAVLSVSGPAHAKRIMLTAPAHVGGQSQAVAAREAAWLIAGLGRLAVDLAAGTPTPCDVDGCDQAAGVLAAGNVAACAMHVMA